MFQSLKDALAKRRHSEEQTSAKAYEQLLADAVADRLSERDADRVDKILKQCGRSLQQLEADTNLRREQTRLEELADQLPARQAEYTKLRDAHAKAVRELEREQQARLVEITRMDEAVTRAMVEINESTGAKGELIRRFPASNVAAVERVECKLNALQGQISAAELAKRQKTMELNAPEVSGTLEKMTERKEEGNRVAGFSAKSQHVARLKDEISAIDEQLAQWKEELQDLAKESKRLAKSAS